MSFLQCKCSSSHIPEARPKYLPNQRCCENDHCSLVVLAGNCNTGGAACEYE